VLQPDPSLYPARFVATLVGTVLALAVSWLIPTWRSKDAPRYLTTLMAALRTWTAATMAALVNPSSVDPGELRAAGSDVRRTLVPLRLATEAAMLEPTGHIDRDALMHALVAAERMDMNLLALAAHAQYLNRGDLPGLICPDRANSIVDQLNGARRAPGVAPVTPVAVQPISAQPPLAAAEHRALLMQLDQLNETAAALSHAASEVLR